MTRYPLVHQLIHWLTAAGVLFAVPAGLVMVNIGPGSTQNTLFDLHRSVGATVLLLAGFRVLSRILLGVPPPYPGLKRWQAIASKATHHLLYVLLFAVPLVGWAGTSAYPAPIRVFGLFTLPAILGPDRALSEALMAVHRNLALLMAAIVLVHVGGALYHAVVERDGVLARMLPGRH